MIFVIVALGISVVFVSFASYTGYGNATCNWIQGKPHCSNPSGAAFTFDQQFGFKTIHFYCPSYTPEAGRDCWKTGVGIRFRW